MFKKVFVLFPIITIFACCENDIDLIDRIKSKPVIYCLLSLDDSVYSVSLTKTFVGEKNVFEMTKNPNEVFYDEATITLDGFSGDSSIWSTSFQRSDQVKEAGIFPSEPGYLFQSNSVITELDEFGMLSGDYRSIDRFVLNVVVPIHKINISTTAPVYLPNYMRSPGDIRKISLYGPVDFSVSIFSQAGSAYRQLNFNVRYLEKLIGQDELIEKEIEIIARKDLQIVHNNINATIPADFFLNKLAAHIPDVDELEYRKFIDFDLILYSADDVFDNYRETNGYTTDLAQPAWSNINEGIGVFSLLFTHKKEGFIFDQRTRDSIAFSPITSSLKFVRWE